MFLVLALTLVLVPTWLAFDSIASTVAGLGRRFASGDLAVPPPDPRVAKWPLVGARAFAAWQRAFETPHALVERLLPQLRPFGRWLMASVGQLLGALAESVFAIILAAVFLANAATCTRVTVMIVDKLLPERGAQFTSLAGATVRSVAQGVIGIAFVQSLCSAVGMVVVGVPAAGVWSALILALAVMQLPPLLVLGPVAVYVFTTHSTAVSVGFLLWSLLVSASDGLLKPFLLGQGVGVPTLVILMGAIGGMISDGIVGLFVGSVVLAVGYQISAASLRRDAGVTDAGVTDAGFVA